MWRRQKYLAALLVGIVVSLANGAPELRINGLDATVPVKVEGKENLMISVAGAGDVDEQNYSVICEDRGRLEIMGGPNEVCDGNTAMYRFVFDDDWELGTVSLISDQNMVIDGVAITACTGIYKLYLCYSLQANTTTAIGIDFEGLSWVAAEGEGETSGLELPGDDGVISLDVSDEPNLSLFYDGDFAGIQEYRTEVSYSDQNIVIEGGEFVLYDSNLVLENCTMDVNGAIECGSDITLVNSVIRVKGTLRVRPGMTITETGPSSIIATGDTENEGRIIMEGELSNPIKINSDYSTPDAEFIIIDANSSANSSLECLDFYGGWTNVWIRNKRLIEPISNCRFFGAVYAIWQDGLDELTDIRFSLFYDNSEISIYLGMDPVVHDETQVWVDNVVIDNNSEDAFGCVITGSEYYWGIFTMSDSIITNCYCGWYLDAATYVWPILSNVAYYGNEYDDNLVDSSPYQTNPMYLAQSPFEAPQNPGDWPYFIDPLSPVAEVNLGCDLWQSAPQQLLTSLHSNSVPRGNKGIGFGMPILPEYSSHVYSVKGDFDDNGIADMFDYSKFAIEWRTVKDSGTNPPHFPDANGYSICDFDYDGTVDALDLGEFCENWLSKGEIQLTTEATGDSLTVTCQHLDGLNVTDYALFLDGKYIGLREPNNNPDLIINKMMYPNGSRSLKAVIRGAGDQPYVTAAEPVLFDTPLSDLDFETIFDPANHYFIRAKVAEGYTATIRLKDPDGQILWSSEYGGDFIAAVDPCNFSAGTANYTVMYEYEDATLSPSSSGSSSIMALDGKPVYDTAGLVICMLEKGMNEGTTQYNTGTCRFAARMMQKRGVVPITLLGYGTNSQVTEKMLKKVFKKYPKIRYMHIFAHGNYEADGAGLFGFDIPRTILLFNDGIWPTHNSTMWTSRGKTVPADYDYLSSGLEKAPCLANLPFSPDQLRIVVLESCYAARTVATENADWTLDYIDGAFEWELEHNANRHPTYPYSDVCFALMMYNSKQMVLGSGSVVIEGWYTYYRQFFNTFWNQLGDGESAEGAINEAIEVTTYEVLKNFRVRGVAYTPDIYLKTNP